LCAVCPPAVRGSLPSQKFRRQKHASRPGQPAAVRASCESQAARRSVFLCAGGRRQEDSPESRRKSRERWCQHLDAVRPCPSTRGSESRLVWSFGLLQAFPPIRVRKEVYRRAAVFSESDVRSAWQLLRKLYPCGQSRTRILGLVALTHSHGPVSRPLECTPAVNYRQYFFSRTKPVYGLPDESQHA